MTTNLSRNRLGPPREYLERPEPPPEAMRQIREIVDADSVLRLHFEPDLENDFETPFTVVVSGGCVIHYDRNDQNRKLTPDLLVAFDVDAEQVWYEDRYLLWEVGKAPDFVLEIASRTTSREDLEVKPPIYEAMGVGEYWRYDPSLGNFYGFVLAADRLVNGRFEPLPVERMPDGRMRGYSPALDLFLYVGYYNLRFFDPKTGEFLYTAKESRSQRRAEQAARQEAEAALESEQAARQAAIQDAEAERAARRAAEERIRALEAQLGDDSA